MAKKFGKRKRAKSPVVVPQAFDVDAAFAAPRPAPRPGRAPASNTPLADRLQRGGPGVTDSYVVLPRTLAEDMPLPWQQQLASLLAQYHETHGGLSWPTYRVVPSRPERLVDLDEEQLAEVGYLVELDAEGDMVYRDRSGRRVEDPENTVALVPCLDPIVRRPETGQEPGLEAEPARREAVPMNIGPQPVWRSTTSARTAPAPPLPPPPTATSVSSPPTGSRPEAGGSAAAAGPVEPGAADGADRDWFDDGEEAEQAPAPEQAQQPDEQAEQPAAEEAEEAAAAGFGPTGDEPTEIPYRYRH